ncbi:unnamed protein product [Gemmata massiliana]|uniref:Uncharacterized protein n=1 Tax=Gemmata massiliana TaxID=1210884 RepID=A0A6P2CZH5_9BACT|nr:unnamed protein product [Gemmata massiliana]
MGFILPLPIPFLAMLGRYCDKPNRLGCKKMGPKTNLEEWIRSKPARGTETFFGPVFEGSETREWLVRVAELVRFDAHSVQ